MLLCRASQIWFSTVIKIELSLQNKRRQLVLVFMDTRLQL